MDLSDFADQGSAPFEKRYKTYKPLWWDGPWSGFLAFDNVLDQKVVLNIPYDHTVIDRFLHVARTHPKGTSSYR